MYGVAAPIAGHARTGYNESIRTVFQQIVDQHGLIFCPVKCFTDDLVIPKQAVYIVLCYLNCVGAD